LLSFSLFFLFETKLCQLFYPQNPQKSEMSITRDKKKSQPSRQQKKLLHTTREEEEEEED